MNEYTPATEATSSIEELQQQIASLKVHAEVASQGIDSWYKRFNKIKATLQEFAEDGSITDGTALDDYLIEEFDLELTEEVEITITLTYSASVTVPKGTDVELDCDVEGVPGNLVVNYGGVEIEDQWITFDQQEITTL